jgi:periplasmic copper chaperone A
MNHRHHGLRRFALFRALSHSAFPLTRTSCVLSTRNVAHCIVAADMFVAQSVLAHVTMQPSDGHAGAALQAWFTVPHGCDGAATVAIRIKVPEGVTQVKPQMKSGWKVTIKRRKLERPFNGEGCRTITETVDEVEWRGGPLPDELYDDFGMKAEGVR